VGIGLGLLKGTWSVLLKTEQVINGLVLVPIGIGLSNVLYKAQFKDLPTAPRITPMEPLALPLLHKIPVLGPALFNRSPLVYLTLLLVAGVWYFLNRTRAGMIVRGAGESPEALDFSGVPVHSYRFLAVLVGTALTGFAGALLAVDQVYLYHPAMTAGRGWIAIAIVIVGGWRPWHCLLAALFFGFIDMLQFQFQIQSATVPYEALLSLPYLATVLALAWRRQGVRPPAALGVPFLK
jgi:simple sugar transport system permease protein